MTKAREPTGVNEVNTPELCSDQYILELPHVKVIPQHPVDVSQERTGLNEVNSTGGAVEVARWSCSKPACQVEKLPITVRGNLRPDWTWERSTRHPI